MDHTTPSPAIPTDTPWTAEPSGDGFHRVVNSKSVVLAQRCVSEEAQLFAAAPELLTAATEAADLLCDIYNCLPAVACGDTAADAEELTRYREVFDLLDTATAKAKGRA